MPYAASEAVEDGFQTVHLVDSDRGMEAVVIPGLGNNTAALAIDGANFLWRPERSLTDLLELRSLFGVPFLSPWANRFDSEVYWVNGSSYKLNTGLGNLRFDHDSQPIHGLLLFEHWQVHHFGAGDDGAELVCRFPFSAYPKLMAQFPFAHSLEMRHTLREGRLHISVTIFNECTEPFPVTLGFHPYFTLPGSDRNEWRLTLAGRTHHALSGKSVPTGAVSPTGSLHLDVKAVELDDVYSELDRQPDGYAHFGLSSERACLTVGFGAHYPVSVVYAPHTGNFVCLEPMAGLTNALNLAHAGAYPELQSIEPGGSWQEEFWIEPSLKLGAR